MANVAPTRKRTKAKPQPAAPLPRVIAPTVDAPRLKTAHGSFDLDDAVLPQWVEERAFRSGDYPYEARMKNRPYKGELEELQVELVKLQAHVIKCGLRVVIIFEGRDAAGKGGAIAAFRENLNPRAARTVALPKPNEAERGQWYFQRYVAWLPTAGEIVLFDRSWYNRAGVEPIMGFCTRSEQTSFLEAVPGFEKMLVDQGITLFKFYLDIGREMQLKRLYDRRHDPLKVWKLSPVDYVAMTKWDEYTRARDEMLIASHRPDAPWTVVKANDKRRARLNIIRRVLSASRYEGKDEGVVRKPDPLILAEGPRLIGVEKRKRSVAAAEAN